MLILSLCDNPSVLKIFYLIKIVMTIIQIAVPLILIFTVTMDFVKGTANATAPADILKTCMVRIIAASLVFFVPLFFTVVMKIAGDSTDVSMCWNKANPTDIASAQNKYDEEEKKKQEETQQKQEETNKNNELDKIYTSKNSHTNSINGIRYMLYDQADSRWGKTKYENGKTIAEIGCLITSMAVISSSANPDVTPLYVFEKKANNYYMTNAIPKLAGSDNFKCVVGSITHDNFVKDLSKGKVGIIKVEADSVFTSSQHYMSLIDISEDGKQIYVGNSYGGGTGSYNRTGWFPIKTVLTDVHEYVVCTPSQNLIDRFK